MASLNSLECHICRLPLARSFPSRQNECAFCGRVFRRVDGVKRHTKTCASRGNRPLPADTKRGRKLHACDICSRVKVSCDSKTPCTRCASRGLSCTYGRLCNDPAHLARSTIEGQPQSQDNGHLELPFLLACTDPSVGTVDEVILTREPEQSSRKPTPPESAVAYDAICDTIDPRLLFLSFIGPSFSMGLDHDDMDRTRPSSTLNRGDLDTSNEGLQLRVSVLEDDLQQVAAAEPNLQKLLSKASSEAFFTVSNFRDCIDVFFQREQLLATIIHRSTFLADQVDPSLLLAIVVSGSAYLHFRQARTDFASFTLAIRAVAEKYIFQYVEQLVSSTYQSDDVQRTLEVCQAAYIIITLQFCIKDAKIRQRLITKCHPMLVDLLRSREMIGMRHDSSQSERSWYTFVYKESCIRLIHWVFINDAWFTLFSNHPPAMTSFDMSGHLPCRDELWNADSSASLNSLVFQHDLNSGLPCLKSLIAGLLGEEWTEHTTGPYLQLEAKHFLVIILAFQHIIFHYHTSMIIENSSSILFRALDRWNQLWNNAMDRIGIDERKTLGVVKYSPELEFVSRRIVEANNAKENMRPKFLQRRVTYDTAALYQFIQQCIE